MIRAERGRNALLTAGIIGSERGVGVTHLSIMLAGFLSSKEHRRTALIELNHAGTFASLKRSCRCESSAEGILPGGFSINGIDFFSVQTEAGLARVLGFGYDAVVFDLADEWDENFSELLRCDIRCVVGSSTEWKLESLEKAVLRLERDAPEVSVNYLSASGSEKNRREMRKRLHLDLRSIPYEATPFELHRQNFTFFQGLRG